MNLDVLSFSYRTADGRARERHSCSKLLRIVLNPDHNHKDRSENCTPPPNAYTTYTD